MMENLQKQYPATTFIHCSVPITSKLTGMASFKRNTKNVIKKIIGKPVYENFNNSGRYKLNELLRQKYGTGGRFFDIARFESTLPDGSRSTYSEDGKTYYALVNDYSYDGGHLNEAGRKIVAEQLLLLLANMP